MRKGIVDSETTFLCEMADGAAAFGCINRPGSQGLQVTTARAVALKVSPGRSLHFCRYSVAILPEPSCGDTHGVFWPSELHSIFHALCCALPAVGGCAVVSPQELLTAQSSACCWRMVSRRQRRRLWLNELKKKKKSWGKKKSLLGPKEFQ